MRIRYPYTRIIYAGVEKNYMVDYFNNFDKYKQQLLTVKAKTAKTYKVYRVSWYAKNGEYSNNLTLEVELFQSKGDAQEFKAILESAFKLLRYKHETSYGRNLIKVTLDETEVSDLENVNKSEDINRSETKIIPPEIGFFKKKIAKLFYT